MWIFWIILLVIVAIFLFLYSYTSDGLQCIAGQLYVLCFLGVVLSIHINTLEVTPTALDVYRGNTELKITSVDGVPTDTVVVFKNK